MSNSNFKNRLLSFYGKKDTDFPETNSINGSEKVAIVQDNLNVLTTINDLLSLASVGFILAPKSANTIEEVAQWFKTLSKGKGQSLGAVVSYYDRDSDMYEVVRYIGQNLNPISIENVNNWEWFTSGASSFKGLFNTERELREGIKNPKVGDHAFVGNTIAESYLYICNRRGVWIKSKKLFKDFVSKNDVVFSYEVGDTLEMYDEYIAEKAFSDLDGNPIHTTYAKKSDIAYYIKDIKNRTNKELEKLVSQASNKLLINTDDLRFGLGDKLEFADRLNTDESKYGFVYFHNNLFINENYFSKQENIIYYIRFNHNLSGSTINIPDNTILDFTGGGAFSSGTLNFGKNCIIRILDRSQLDNITFTGNPVKTLDASLASQGEPGLSAYEEAKKKGLPNTDTFEGWIESFKGKDGKTPEITISSNDTWVIDGVDTMKKSKGEDGKGIQGNPGTKGDKGDDGITPKFKVEDNWLQVSYDRGVMWEKLFEFSSTHQPPKISRPNVYSFSKTALDEVTNEKLKTRNYNGEIYKGDVMDDNSFTYKSTILHESISTILYGDTETYSENTRFGEKNSTYRYAYDATRFNWKSENIVVLTYDKVNYRTGSLDWKDPSVEYPTSDIYFSTKSNLNEVSFSTVSNKITNLKAHKVSNEGIIGIGILGIDFNTKLKEYPLENISIYDAIYVYRKIQKGEAEFLREEGVISLYKKATTAGSIDSTFVKIIDPKTSKTAVVINNTKVSEINYYVVAISNGDTSGVNINTDVSSNISITKVHQFGTEVIPLGNTYILDMDYPTTILVTTPLDKAPNVRTNTPTSGDSNRVETKRNSDLSRITFYTTKNVLENDISILAQDRNNTGVNIVDEDLF